MLNCNCDTYEIREQYVGPDDEVHLVRSCNYCHRQIDSSVELTTFGMEESEKEFLFNWLKGKGINKNVKM